VTFGATAYRVVSAADRFLSGIQVGIAERAGTLVTLFCHSLFESEREMEMGLLNPLEQVTCAKYRELIESFLRRGYRIVSIEDVARGLDARQKSLLLTFDDGYANNRRVLPILEEFKATAVIFLSANHVKEGRPYWWDVIYRIRRGQGRTLDEIATECSRLNTEKTETIEAKVRAAAPTVPFTTVSDLDRPFKTEEIRELAGSGRIFFENHTANHAVLSAYSAQEVFREIADAQDTIEKMSGRRPIAIAYPNGSHTPTAADAARRAGLKLGFATFPRKEYVKDLRDENRALRMGRFQPTGTVPTEEQTRFFRSDLLLTQRLQELKRGL
jgi:peptidoglycan/xylan/chitin deacetylase (PgdA/CDA1 family)